MKIYYISLQDSWSHVLAQSLDFYYILHTDDHTQKPRPFENSFLEHTISPDNCQI